LKPVGWHSSIVWLLYLEVLPYVSHLRGSSQLLVLLMEVSSFAIELFPLPTLAY
jgi:hypothetical protein